MGMRRALTVKTLLVAICLIAAPTAEASKKGRPFRNHCKRVLKKLYRQAEDITQLKPDATSFGAGLEMATEVHRLRLKAMELGETRTAEKLQRGYDTLSTVSFALFAREMSEGRSFAAKAVRNAGPFEAGGQQRGPAFDTATLYARQALDALSIGLSGLAALNTPTKDRALAKRLAHMRAALFGPAKAHETAAIGGLGTARKRAGEIALDALSPAQDSADALAFIEAIDTGLREVYAK